MIRVTSPARLSTLAVLSTLIAAGLVGCVETPETALVPADPVAAYAELGRKLQVCRDAEDACVAAAAGDATAIAACEAEATSCRDQTRADQDRARGSLRRGAGDCYRGRAKCDEDAGEDSCRPNRRNCMRRNSPPQSACIDALLECLDTSTASGMVTNEQVEACVEQAHTCLMSQMPMGRSHGRDGDGRSGRRDGEARDGAAGQRADDGDDRRFGRGDRGPRQGAAGQGSDDGDDADDDARGRGQGPRGPRGVDAGAAGGNG